jgi:hypothetical protein
MISDIQKKEGVFVSSIMFLSLRASHCSQSTARFSPTGLCRPHSTSKANYREVGLSTRTLLKRMEK